MSPLHKLQQTVVNKISFIIEWVYWIQLLYSCTCENHVGSDTRYCSCGIYFRRRQSLQKQKNCVKIFVWLAAGLQARQSISSSLKGPARKQLRENMPYPNDMRSATRIVTQTNLRLMKHLLLQSLLICCDHCQKQKESGSQRGGGNRFVNTLCSVMGWSGWGHLVRQCSLWKRLDREMFENTTN